MQRNGVTPEQSAGYMPGVSTLLYDNVNPVFDYYNDTQTGNVLKDVWSSATDPKYREQSKAQRGREHLTELEDAWRMYLGMPQTKNSFGISDYVPSRSADSTPYYYKFNNFMDILMRDVASGNEGLDSNERMKKVVEQVRAAGGSMPAFDETELGWALKNHTLGTGQDAKGQYLSYYDKWDLAPHLNGTQWNVSKNVGQPFEIYDRVYYDPETYETIPPWPPRPNTAPLWQTDYFAKGGPPDVPAEEKAHFAEETAIAKAEAKERAEMERIAASGVPLEQVEGDRESLIALLRRYDLFDKYATHYELKNKKPFYEN
jgi:hypothetical protein